jgi:hypothetical protein
LIRELRHWRSKNFSLELDVANIPATNHLGVFYAGASIENCHT